jgi:hypothetical protein
MRRPRRFVLPRHPILLLLVVGLWAAMADPLAAGGKKEKKNPPELAVCWQEMQRIFDAPPTEAGRGFAFGYIETTLRVQWDPEKGLDEEPCYPDGLRRIALHSAAEAETGPIFANGCKRGEGFFFLASDLVPGVLVLREVPYSTRGMDFYLTLPEPIRFVVVPSSAVFVGSFRVVAGPLYPNDPHPRELPTVTLEAIDAPSAAELAVELAPVFGQPWRSYLEAVAPPALQPQARR